MSMCDGSAGVAVFEFRSSVIFILTHCVQFSFVIFTSSFLTRFDDIDSPSSGKINWVY